MNTPGATVSDETMAKLAERIHDSTVLVGIWVGPSGGRALGTPGQLLGAAAVTGMAPGTRIGDFGDPLPVDGFELDFGSATELLRTDTLGADDARARGALEAGCRRPRHAHAGRLRRGARRRRGTAATP